MKRGLIAACVFMLLVSFTLPAASQQKLPEIKFEKYELPNGLDVILHEDHSIPMVTVNFWYHVGSKNEKRGRTGFAHLFEHMMFTGSEHVPNYDTPMEKIGGHNNGSTNSDRTNYWENLPANYLELGLWLESDRMGYLKMDQEKLDIQRGVVQNEKRQSVDNQPYGSADVLLKKILYPDNHPYSWTVIGEMEDLTAATQQDVKEFFKMYYAPNNASLCIAGDFDPAVAKKFVEKYFASIPPGPPVARIKTWVPRLDHETRSVTTDKVELPRLYMAWHTPPFYAPGDASFDIIASALGSGKTSRLYKKLVYEMQIAQDVAVYQSSSEISSTFNIVVTARKGHTLEEIEKVIDSELKKVFADGLTDEEIARSKANTEAGFVRRLERVGGFGSKADLLNQYNTFLGNPDMFQWDLDRRLKPTKKDILKYAKDYLGFNQRAVLYILPQGDPTAVKDELDRTVEPGPLPEPAFMPPAILKDKLSNGMEIYLVEKKSLPLVQMSLQLQSGWAADPADRPGTANLTADMIDEGTKTRTAFQISDEADMLGANFNTGSNFDGSTVNLNILKSKIDKGLELMADVVLNPTFPEDELARKKLLYIGRIQQEERQPFTRAIKYAFTSLYGKGHPYGQPYTGSGTEESINALTRKDLTNFYKDNYKPNNAAMIVVGDISMDEVKAKINKAFAGWKKGNVKKVTIPDPKPLKSTQIYILDKPGAPQTALVAGNIALKRSNPDYLACEVVNTALGGIFTSRLNMNLREDKAYTYGAGSTFMGTKGVGVFIAYSQVQGKFTSESVHEMVKELTDISGSRPLAGDELNSIKANLVKGYPEGFETIGGIAGQLGSLVRFGLPLDDWKTYTKRIESVTGEETVAAAKKYIRNNALLIVAVGDAETIASKIKALNIGEIHIIK